MGEITAFNCSSLQCGRAADPTGVVAYSYRTGNKIACRWMAELRLGPDNTGAVQPAAFDRMKKAVATIPNDR